MGCLCSRDDEYQQIGDGPATAAGSQQQAALSSVVGPTYGTYGTASADPASTGLSAVRREQARQLAASIRNVTSLEFSAADLDLIMDVNGAITHPDLNLLLCCKRTQHLLESPVSSGGLGVRLSLAEIRPYVDTKDDANRTPSVQTDALLRYLTIRERRKRLDELLRSEYGMTLTDDELRWFFNDDGLIDSGRFNSRTLAIRVDKQRTKVQQARSLHEPVPGAIGLSAEDINELVERCESRDNMRDLVLNVLGLEANEEKITEMWDEQQRNHQRRFAAISVGGASGSAHQQANNDMVVGSPVSTSLSAAAGASSITRTDTNGVNGASSPPSRTHSSGVAGGSGSMSRTSSSPAAAALVAAASSSSRTVSSPRGPAQTQHL